MYVSHTDLHAFPSEAQMTKPVAHGSLVRKSFTPASDESNDINDPLRTTNNSTASKSAARANTGATQLPAPRPQPPPPDARQQLGTVRTPTEPTAQHHRRPTMSNDDSVPASIHDAERHGCDARDARDSTPRPLPSERDAQQQLCTTSTPTDAPSPPDASTKSTIPMLQQLISEHHERNPYAHTPRPGSPRLTLAASHPGRTASGHASPGRASADLDRLPDEVGQERGTTTQRLASSTTAPPLLATAGRGSVGTLPTPPRPRDPGLPHEATSSPRLTTSEMNAPPVRSSATPEPDACTVSHA